MGHGRYVTLPDAALSQTWGVGWYCLNTNASAFVNNTMVSFKPSNTQFHYLWSLPVLHTQSPTSTSATTDASLAMRVAGAASMNGAGVKPPFPPSQVATLAQWQQLTGNDAGAAISADIDVAIAEGMLEL